MASGHASPPAILATKVVFTVLAALLTIARLYTRTQIVRNAGWDDVCIAISLMGSAVLSVITCMQLHYGMGSSTKNLDPADASKSLFWLWMSITVYSFALGFVKTSILLQYLRILPRSVRSGPLDERTPRNKYRVATLVTLAVVSVYSIWATLGSIFTCLPVQKFWNNDLHGTCLPRQTLWFVAAGLNIATEVVTVAIPLPVLYSLPIPTRQKHILLFVFSIAGVSVAISISRVPFLYIYAISSDKPWNGPIISIMSSLEVNIGIIASCIPTLKGLVSRVFPSFSKEDRSATRTNTRHSRDISGGNDLLDLEATSQPEDRCSSAGTATHLNASYFNATARLDD